MKKFFALIPTLLFAFTLMAQPPNVPADKGTNFGEAIPDAGSVSADMLAANLTEAGKEKQVVVTGKIVEVCKAEGCWVRMETSNGSFLVKMKDHAFLVPLALNGKQVVAAGTATFKETSVEQLRHFAEDAGKSKEEIAKITEPKKEIVLNATGIKVLD